MGALHDPVSMLHRAYEEVEMTELVTLIATGYLSVG